MMAKLLLDQFADMTAMTPELAPLVQFAPDKHGRPVAMFLKNTVFTGEQALALCRSGQAAPADEECAEAVGIPSERLRWLQVGYEMDMKGVHSEGDRALYRAGVILGYDEKTLKHIPGPNWDKYQDAKRKRAEAGDE